jgi:hypothetical protein
MDRRAFVRGLVVGAVLLCWPSGGAAQEPSVTFRTETSLIEWACGFYGPGGPVTHLTEKSFSVVFDKKVPVAVTVLQPTPGSYHVYFSPPDNLRDGKKHRVDVTVLDVHPKKKQWKMKAKQITLQKPTSEGQKH